MTLNVFFMQRPYKQENFATVSGFLLYYKVWIWQITEI